MPVITIAREFGSGGARVANLLGERLGGVEVIDQRLVAEVARRMGLTTDEVAAEDERHTGLADRIVRSFATVGDSLAGWLPAYDVLTDPEEAVLKLTEEVIRDAARRGNAIVVGRGGAFVLADWPSVLRVFLRADEEFRLRQVMARLNLSEREARRQLRKVDAGREAYMCAHYGAEWRDPRHYDLVVDTGRLGHEATTRLILAALGC